MTLNRNTLTSIYVLIAVLALIGTWGNNIAYMGNGLMEANIIFWRETLSSPASRSITVDLFFLGLAVLVWMVLEARRLGMRGVWLYFILGLFIAISVTVPAFFIHRERVLAKLDANHQAGSLTMGDAMGLAIVTIASIGYTIVALR